MSEPDLIERDEACYLLVKRGLYYRPERLGYTGTKAEAGRYTLADAAELINHGVSFVHEDNAEEFTSSCDDDVKIRHLETTIARLSEALAEAEKKGAEDWQPIETAPKDGTIFLGFAKGTAGTGRFWISQCKWVGPSERHPGSSLDWYMWQNGWPQPTHWRPLPAQLRDLSQGGQHG